MTEKQKELLIALAKEGKIRVVTSGKFVRNYRLPSPSSVQAALRGLPEKDFITQGQGVYARIFPIESTPCPPNPAIIISSVIKTIIYIFGL